MFWELNRNSWCMSIFFSVEILTSVSISVGLVCTSRSLTHFTSEMLCSTYLEDLVTL